MLRRLLSLVRRKSLLDVGDEPLRLVVRGRVASENEVVSPVTGTKAALFCWRFFARKHLEDPPYLRTGRGMTRPHLEYEHLDTVPWGSDVVVACKGGDVLVPVTGLTIRVLGAKSHGTALTEPLPPGFEHLEERAGKWPLCLDELAITRGDRVDLTAFVARRAAADASQGEYRSKRAPEFVARADRGRVLLEDLSLLRFG